MAHKNTSNSSDLENILKQLIENKDSMSAEGFDKIISEFDGVSIPVKKWFENYEDNAEAYDLNERQKYVHARSKMAGKAKLFLDSQKESDFVTLKELVVEEFDKKIDSAEIHKKLQNRKKSENETFHEYVLHMNKTAALGKLEESATIKYIIEGLNVGNDAKYLLYTSKTLKELREKYEIVKNVGETKPIKNHEFKKQHKNDFKKVIHCFNCGSADHMRSECKTNTKCTQWTHLKKLPAINENSKHCK